MLLSDVHKALSYSPEISVTTAGRIYVEVPLGARRHRVRVFAVDDWLRVEGRIVKMVDLEAIPKTRDITARLLHANHIAELVSLTCDEDDWLVARYDVPPEAEVDEWVDAVKRVARVADRWELLWTGQDIE